MDETRRNAAFAAASLAQAHLTSARKHLMGDRLPLAGLHYDFDKITQDLAAARDKIEEAAKAVEVCRQHAQVAVD